MYISLQDIGLFVLFLITIIVSIYLIAVLRQTFCVLGHIKGILDDHDDNIRETLSVLPETLAHIDELAVSLKMTADQTNSAFGSLQNNLTDTVDDLRDGLETFTIYAKVFVEVFRSVFSK